MVSQYYQQIFRLWEHARIPADRHIEKLICILQVLISVPLLGCHYTNIKDLLDQTRNIKDMKKDIIVNFLKQERFATSRLNWEPRRLARKSVKKSAGSVKSAAKSTDMKKALQELIGTTYI